MKNVKEILKETTPYVDFNKIYENFIEDGLLDSLDLMKLITALDTEYNISIEGIDIIPENFNNINSIENMLKKYKV